MLTRPFWTDVVLRYVTHWWLFRLCVLRETALSFARYTRQTRLWRWLGIAKSGYAEMGEI